MGENAIYFSSAFFRAAVDEPQDNRHHQCPCRRACGVEQDVGYLLAPALDKVLVQLVQSGEYGARGDCQWQFVQPMLMLKYSGQAEAEESIKGEVRRLAQRVVVLADEGVGGFTEKQFQEFPQRALAGFVGDFSRLGGKEEDGNGNRNCKRKPDNKGNMLSFHPVASFTMRHFYNTL